MFIDFEIFSAIILLSTVYADSPYQPKTTSGVYCKVPFEYQGQSYQDCTMAGSTKPWCYTTGSDWDYCDLSTDLTKCEVATPATNSSEINLIIQLLNNMRSKEPAVRMAKIKWNSELAMRSQFMSNTCQMGNSNTKLCSSTGNMGQISYMSMSTDPLDSQWMQFLLEFYNKKSSYNFDTNQCSIKYCNGYKQIVNAATLFVGCARSSCKTESMYADYYFCNFYPPIYSGKPYDQGIGSCDRCYKLDESRMFRCDNNLCDICHSPSNDCQGKEMMDQAILSGSLCVDTNPSFCSQNSFICQYLHVLPADKKDMFTSQCKKTCKTGYSHKQS